MTPHGATAYAWPMVQIAILQSNSKPTIEQWLGLTSPTDFEVAGDVALLSFGAALSRDKQGRSAGAFSGVLFNDLEIAQALIARGLVAPRASHQELVTTEVSQFGPNGMAALRMQGVAAVLHRTQHGCLIATGSVGVGPVYVRHLDDGWVATTDLRVLAALDPAGQAWLEDPEPQVGSWVGAALGDERTLRVVAGSALMMPGRGPQFDQTRWQPTAEPFFRQRPDVLAAADAANAAVLLSDAIADAAAATTRGRGPLWLGPTHNTCQQWLRRVAQGRGVGLAEADAACRWSFLGARTLSERMRWPAGLQEGTAQERLDRLHKAWTTGFPPPTSRPPLPEPLPKDDAERAGQRLLRHTAFAHALAARAWQRAANNDWSVAWPHLDPRVLAIAGALDPAILKAALERPPNTDIAQA